MAFFYDRMIYFADTDAAGFVYFANLLSICSQFATALQQHDRSLLQEAGPAGCDSDKCLLPEAPPKPNLDPPSPSQRFQGNCYSN